MLEPVQIRADEEETSEVTHEDYLRDYEIMQKAVKEEIAENKRRAEQTPQTRAPLEEITF